MSRNLLTITLLSMIFVSASATAGGRHADRGSSILSRASSSADANSNSSSVSEAYSGAEATASGGLGGSSTQTQSLISIGGPQASAEEKFLQPQANSGGTIGDVLSPTTNVNVITENPDDIKIKNTPDIMAPFANSTSPCRIAGSGGLSFPGVGISGGGSVEDEECTLRQTAQTFGTLGVPAMGMWLLCRSKVMERVGTDSDACDAMIAQWQIEAEFAGGDDLGKLDSSLLLASYDEEEFEAQRAKQESLEEEIGLLQERLARERRARKEIEESIDDYRVRDLERRRRVLEMLSEDQADG